MVHVNCKAQDNTIRKWEPLNIVKSEVMGHLENNY